MNQTDQKAVQLVEQARGALHRAEELLDEKTVSRAVVQKAHSDTLRALSALHVELYDDSLADAGLDRRDAPRAYRAGQDIRV